MIAVLSVDDHPLLREGIAAPVNGESDMKLVAEASSGQEAIEKFRLHRPDGGAGAHFRRFSVASPTRRL
jgi:chemotaxis response regulator CheB